MPDSTNQCGLSGTSRTDIFHDIAVDELTQMLNDEGFILESCSQHFFFEKQIKKWKLVYKKTDD